MKSFKEYLEERFINLIGDHPDKDKHAEHVFSMLQNSYKDQGGIHGSGFKSPEDMKKNIPMWKLAKKNGRVVAAALYKDKGGRKRVAVATDGSEEGKAHLSRIMTDDMTRNRSYSEQSGKSLSFLKKNLPEGHLKKLALKHEHVRNLFPGEEIRKPPKDDPEIQRHPELADHFYQRKIGDEWHTKIALGTAGKKIA